MDNFENSLSFSTGPDRSNELEEALTILREHGIDPDRALDEAKAQAMSIVRCALASILNPERGSSAALEAAIIGLAIGFPGLESEVAQAKIHGVHRASISKRVLEFADMNGLPPSCYMRSAKSRKSYEHNGRAPERGRQ